jgi:Hemerythrin HHE cation binding domain/Phasin protein
MTITQLIQSSPAKANELFGKLEDTSDGALKTRERLLGDLKAELETLMDLEEKHLFPVLKKHQETKGLVADAVGDNRQVRKLLSELEKLPKSDPDFAPKLTELRKVFQSHVRDEKKELLPAVRKALSTEEANAIVEKIEAGRAEAAEEARNARKSEGGQTGGETVKAADAAAKSSTNAEKSAEASSRKVAEVSAGTARKTAEATVENTQRVVDAAAEIADDVVGKTSETAADAANTMARMAGTAANTATENARRAFRSVDAGAGAAKAAGDAVTQTARQAVEIGAAQMEQAASAINETTRAAERATEPLMRQGEATAQVPVTSINALKDFNEVWADLLRQNMETGARAAHEMLTLRTPQQIAQAQGRIAAELLSAWVKAGSRLVEISFQASGSMAAVSREAAKEVERTTAGR